MVPGMTRRGGTDPELAQRPRLHSIAGGSRASAPRDEMAAALVERARTGDLQAWSRLYQEHYDAVFRHLCYLMGDTSAAEDLAQDVFARAMTHIDRFDGHGELLAWLRGIALNVARMHWRRSGTKERVHAAYERTQPAVADEDLDRSRVQEERMGQLYAVLATLPENLREAFVLRELEGRTPEEAAVQLGISEGNVAVRASRARTRIREELERRGWLGGGR
jgi:RNA polymerase sigma-70 factor, ECF subfamily